MATLSRDAASYQRRAEEIQGKLKGKNILLDNPETMRLKKPKNIKCHSNVLKCAARRQHDKALYSALR